jgi:TldD protein
VKVPLSPFLTERKEILRTLLQRLGEEFSALSLLATDCSGVRYTIQKKAVSVQDSRWGERGAVVRIHDGTGYLEHSFNDLPHDAGGAERLAGELQERLRGLVTAARQAGAGRVSYPAYSEPSLTASWQEEVELPPDMAEQGEVIRRLSALKERALSLRPELVDMRVVYEGVTVAKLYLSPRRELQQAYLWSQGYLIPTLRRGERMRWLACSFSGLKGLELIAEMEAALEETLSEAEELLAAEPVEPGEYEVILSPLAAGLLAHESFGHGVEMDLFVKRRARAQAYLGRPVASEQVTMHDGARAARQTGSYWFDDEGVLGGDTVMIDRGTLRTGISDLLSALKLGVPPSGNGRRESFERKAYARMSNTFFAPGSDSLQEMIRSVRRGYLLGRFVSGMEDPRNWGVQGLLAHAREIRDGKLTGRMVAPVIMTGYVPDVLSRVSMVSGELALSGSGMCGKGHKEYVKNSTGGPYVKTVMRLG